MENCYNVLLIGETGSGKSTLINTATNLFRNGSLKNLKVAIPVNSRKTTEEWKSNEANVEKPEHSQTAECSHYLFRYGGVSFNFVDTPGLSDPCGNMDDINLGKILEEVICLGTIAALIVVLNGANPRHVASVKNALNLMRGSLPDVVLDNRIVVLTNCNSTANFQMSSLGDWTVDESRVFVMNNSAFGTQPPDEYTKLNWRDSFVRLKKMLQLIKSMKKIDTKVFEEMGKKRDAIKAEIAAASLEIANYQSLLVKLKDIQRRQTGTAEEMEENRDYIKKRREPREKMIDTNYYSTLCIRHPETICHSKCEYNAVVIKFCPTTGNSEKFKLCACMDKERKHCKVCGCEPSQHYHAYKDIVTVYETVEEVLLIKQMAFENASNDFHQQQKTELTISSLIESANRLIANRQNNIEQLCAQLKNICSNFNFKNELDTIIQMLEMKARHLQSDDARQKGKAFVTRLKVLVNRMNGSVDVLI